MRVKWEWTAEEQARYQALVDLVALIPDSASVSASRFLVPHVSNRQEVYIHPLGGHADYLLLQADNLKEKGRRRIRARQESWLFTPDALERAIGYLKNGLDIIGENAQLYAGMGYVYSQCVNMGIEMETNISKAREYADVNHYVCKPLSADELSIISNEINC